MQQTHRIFKFECSFFPQNLIGKDIKVIRCKGSKNEYMDRHFHYFQANISKIFETVNKIKIRTHSRYNGAHNHYS